MLPPYSPLRSALFGAAIAACFGATTARAVDAGICRDVERRYLLIKSESTSVQLNTTLFQAADKGCEPLVRALLAAGASLEARDRLGAMPLAAAARSGHLALVDLFLKEGAAIDARNLAGSTALYAAAESDRQNQSPADQTGEHIPSPGRSLDEAHEKRDGARA